jgi:tripartite-type tricarboxylate transporter receptor subunit TctC
MFNLNRKLRLAIAAFLVGAWLAQPANATADPAKDYPKKPVRFIAHSTPGGNPDIVARLIAHNLSKAWGHQFVVDNRPGATGAIAIDLTAKATPDGYTICTITASQIINAAINPKLPYDLTKDITAVSQGTSNFLVLYHSASVPVKSTRELIAYVKANPGKLNYGSPGNGSLQNVAVEMFSSMSGAKLVHVPYRGGAAVMTAALVGEVQVGLSSLITLRPHLSSGRLQALAITAKHRSPTMPELPTVAEAGVAGYEVYNWIGVITGAEVSPAIVKKLSAGIAKVLKMPDVMRRLGADGSTPVGSSPEEFGAYMKSEMARWGTRAKAARLVLH